MIHPNELETMKMKNVFALTQKSELMGQRWWHVDKSRSGRWVVNPAKAKKYLTERAAHISWTAVSAHYRNVKCVPHPEVVA